MAARKSAITRYAAPKPPIINIRGPAPITKASKRGGRRRASSRGGSSAAGSDTMEMGVAAYVYGHMVKGGTKLPTIGPLNGIETVAVAGYALGKHKERGWMGAAARAAIVLAAYGRGSEGSAVSGAGGGRAVGFDDEGDD